ncbi:methyltransferas-like protein [Lophiostoma macrostomum CBS 122681]|uniref:carnosine N-methyltransferase n=1 Tax=Lophiostoma macrostomum CBS 122681 TaxID=1314788 RepID=A0A6A6TM68_9PLEO|nr:methyltransferas-like protein [Lophiostoma macrostomum CBS 122681]
MELDMSNEETSGDFNPMSDPDEQKHLLSVLDSFSRSYRRLAHFNGTHVRRQAFYSLPSEHWDLLSKPPFSVLESLSKVDDLIESNAELAEAIFKAGFKNFLAPTIDSNWVATIVPEKFARDEYKVFSTVMDHVSVDSSETNLDKARSCVNQFYRDWSTEGATERSKCFGPVMNALQNEFQLHSAKAPGLVKSDWKVLVPGAGLGRLVFDICLAGYSVEGNEISYHALMASSLTLNHTTKVGEFTVAPFALNGSNHVRRSDQFKTCRVPDVHPGTALDTATGEMSMSTGDFCVIYNQPGSRDTFDAVATVFFIDTAPNIIRYVEAVRNCLKPGGIWINLGPLLWHHVARPPNPDGGDKEISTHSHEDTGIADPGSVELSDEEVVALVEHLGFSIEKHETGQIETGYILNESSMLQNTYHPSFWVARKN